MTRKDFNDIIHQQYRKLYFIAFRIIRNRQEAEDIVQDVFVRMWSMKEKLDDYKDVTALAVTITKNICIDLLRKMKQIDANTTGYEIQGHDLSPSPYDQMVRSEISEILSGIIGNLPPQYREIVHMKEIDGLSYEEISRQTNMNINSLRVNLSRARRIIREEYIKYNNERGKTERTAGEVL
jgi:RNA polymerase sigma-70 factor (ECF subfamily)